MIALITAILSVAKPILDEVYFNSVMGFLKEYEDTLKQIDTALSFWPSVDDQLLAHLKSEKIRLEDALSRQAALIQVKTGA